MREYVTKQQVIDAIAPMAGVGNRVLDKVRYLHGIPAPEWKSVISDPPEMDEWVLVSSEGCVTVDSIVMRDHRRIWYTSGTILDDDHWMPLPEAWRG